MMSEPQSGQGPSAPVGLSEAFSPAGELPSPFAAFALRRQPGFVRLFAVFRREVLGGSCGRPLGTGISVSAPELVRLRTTCPPSPSARGRRRTRQIGRAHV